MPFVIPKRLLHARNQCHQPIKAKNDRERPKNNRSEAAQRSAETHSQDESPSNPVANGHRVGGQVPKIGIIRTFLAKLLFQKCRERRLIVIMNLDGRIQPDGATARANPAVKLVVLAPHQPLIKQAQPVKNLAREKSVRDRVGGPFHRIEPVTRIANSKSVSAKGLNQLRPVRGAAWMRDKNAADVVRPSAHNGFQAKPQVIFRIGRVGIQAQHVFSTARPDR